MEVGFGSHLFLILICTYFYELFCCSMNVFTLVAKYRQSRINLPIVAVNFVIIFLLF